MSLPFGISAAIAEAVAIRTVPSQRGNAPTAEALQNVQIECASIGEKISTVVGTATVAAVVAVVSLPSACPRLLRAVCGLQSREALSRERTWARNSMSRRKSASKG